MEYNLNLTNGAAHFAYDFLSKGLTTIDEIFIGGGLSKKINKARYAPFPQKDETQESYVSRGSEWMESPYGEIIVEEAERDTLKKAIKTLEEKKTLPSNEYTIELLLATGLKDAPKPA